MVPPVRRTVSLSAVFKEAHQFKFRLKFPPKPFEKRRQDLTMERLRRRNIAMAIGALWTKKD
jgi:hypothetical protein